MIVKLFAIYDHKVGSYGQLMPFRSKGEAIRSFSDAVGDVKSDFCRHPEDYVLFQMAEYDDNSGLVVAGMEPVITALELRKPE